MGRILRAKRRNEEGFRSRFYTLVSRDTDEVMFSARRRTFLVDQGYEFKVIPHFRELVPKGEEASLHYSNPSDQRRLLELIKVQQDEMGLEEIVQTSADDIAGAWQDIQIRKRQALSAKQGDKPVAASKPQKSSHSLFKSWRRK